jgi:hypothetical protein
MNGLEPRVAETIQRLLECFALNELHAQEMLPAAIGSVLVNGNDVRMFELSVDARLLDEAIGLGGFGEIGVEDLYCDVSKEVAIESSDDDARTSTDHATGHEAIVIQRSLRLGRDLGGATRL